ncbi:MULTISPECIES: YgeY family selenium metabolism-linked hydrolase [Aminobacterium]|uniref:YgeY family selenium metabolism-linked hydrolase n=1 Tax=Aminobacterium TaxID=81466 RepID=UPI00257F5F33|nr:YgeY family selenium metabolism-linked hydrolase [Aminobacterium sp. UBA4834]
MSMDWREPLVSLCREMIRRPSLSGQEKEMADFVERSMQELGFDSVERDHYGNVSGRIVLGSGGRRILFEGHMDHVEIVDPSKWTHDPFGAEIVDGRIYGRATSDMKGNLAASMMAASLIKKERADLNGEIIVAGSVHEECFEGVASEAIGKRWNPDCVVIGEASSLNLKRGQRGRAEVVLETYGKSAHSSNPDVGLNAVKTMVPLLAAIEREFQPKEQPVLGKGILELTDIISSPYPGASVVPERCRVTYDRRLLVGETDAEVLDQIQKIIDEEKKRNSKLDAKVALAVGSEMCYTGAPIEATRYAPGWLFPEDNWFVAAALRGLRQAGLNPELSHYAFCTNGSYYAGKAGIPTIGFGGSLESLAHVVDEYIEIDQLEKACLGYMGIIRSVLG